MAEPLTSAAVVLNLIIIESLLSVDNAAVLATMVLQLSKEERNKALKYGIIGAYIFRGVCLFFAAFLIKIWWLKPLAGAYLLYLGLSHFLKKKKPAHHEHAEKEAKGIYKHIKKVIGPFWATVLMVELMDLIFSIDNVFAAVAFTDNILLVWVGVFIGILAMRFVAQGFVRLMNHYPFLEGSAFAVLCVLGLKLLLSLLEHYSAENGIGKMLKENEEILDWGTSVLTIAIFAVPLLTSAAFNMPKRNKKLD